MLYGYFYWWYGEGLKQAWSSSGKVLLQLSDIFSLEILLKTWFAPWKNDVLTARNISLLDQLKLWEGNLASRAIGFLLRSVIIGFSLFLLTLAVFLLAVGLALWIFLPIVIVLLMIEVIIMVSR